MTEIHGLLDYIHRSPTAFHAVSAALAELEGFTRLREQDVWHLAPGGRYVVTRNASSLVAFVMPQEAPSAFQLIASHSDSPTFKLKANPESRVQDLYVRLNVENYGGMLMSTWLDRPLSVAGRVMLRTPHGLEARLVDLERDVALIPNVAIHMNRDANSGFKYNAAVDVQQLIGSAACGGALMDMIGDKLNAPREDIVAADLYLYNRMPGTVWGAKEEYVSSPRLDDLECAYASLLALKAAPAARRHVSVCCVLDNEEVGSGTKQGAAGTLLTDVLRRIMHATAQSEEDYFRALSSSMMLSADNAHAVHPNHPELTDAANCVRMNEGVVIKHNANQKYTTDSVSQAVFTELCRRCGVTVQQYANRSDMAGGSTLGNIASHHLSISMVDIGLAQLAMHSSYETAGVKDLGMMRRAMEAFYRTEIRMADDGSCTLGEEA